MLQVSGWKNVGIIGIFEWKIGTKITKQFMSRRNIMLYYYQLKLFCCCNNLKNV